MEWTQDKVWDANVFGRGRPDTNNAIPNKKNSMKLKTKFYQRSRTYNYNVTSKGPCFDEVNNLNKCRLR